jgi:hypothetical protein
VQAYRGFESHPLRQNQHNLALRAETEIQGEHRFQA